MPSAVWNLPFVCVTNFSDKYTLCTQTCLHVYYWIKQKFTPNITNNIDNKKQQPTPKATTNTCVKLHYHTDKLKTQDKDTDWNNTTQHVHDRSVIHNYLHTGCHALRYFVWRSDCSWTCGTLQMLLLTNSVVYQSLFYIPFYLFFLVLTL